MPVTAKLSRRFYEQFGDETTNELVDLLNSVDATYQASLRELNEINFARFDAKLEQRIASTNARIDVVESRLNARIDGVESRLGSRIEALETRMMELKGDLEARMDRLKIDLERMLDARIGERIAASESRMIRWMVGLWGTTMLTMAGLIVAVLRAR